MFVLQLGPKVAYFPQVIVGKQMYILNIFKSMKDFYDQTVAIKCPVGRSFTVTLFK